MLEPEAREEMAKRGSIEADHRVAGRDPAVPGSEQLAGEAAVRGQGCVDSPDEIDELRQSCGVDQRKARIDEVGRRQVTPLEAGDAGDQAWSPGTGGGGFELGQSQPFGVDRDDVPAQGQERQGVPAGAAAEIDRPAAGASMRRGERPEQGRARWPTTCCGIIRGPASIIG